MSGPSIACVGAGAVGAPAAALLAMAMPDSEICVYDAGIASGADRTFVLANGTWEMLDDQGLWPRIADIAHPLESFQTRFAGHFGGLRLAADDCDALVIGYSVAERDFAPRLRRILGELPNVVYHDGAEVTSLEPDGAVGFRRDGQAGVGRHELVAIAGLPQPLLEKAGFAFARKLYRHVALAATLHGGQPGGSADERILATGAVTTVPRQDGWGHIAIVDAATAAGLAELDDAAYVQQLRQRRWLNVEGQLAVGARGRFQPQQRTAHAGSVGRLVLLGAAACAVHPVAAQELNLGLRDAGQLATALGQHDGNSHERFAADFCARRAPDRARIARATDLAARLLEAEIPGKTACAGVAATLLDLVPPLRGMALARALYPR